MTVRFGTCLALSLCFSATCGAAQERIPPEAFLDAVVGKTLTFHAFPDGWFIGTEEFLRRDLSVWRHREDVCIYGRIAIENEQICFDYDGLANMPVCWATFSDGDRFLVMHGGLGGFEIQEVTSISEDGLSCPVKPGV